MEITPKLTKADIDRALQAHGLQDIGLTVTNNHWHLGNEMGNLNMPLHHLLQTCYDYLKRHKLPMPVKTPMKDVVDTIPSEPEQPKTAEIVDFKPTKKRKFTKEITA